MQIGMGAQEAGTFNSVPISSAPPAFRRALCVSCTCPHVVTLVPPTGKLTDDVAEFVHSWQEQGPNQPPGPTTSSLPRPPCLQQSLGTMQVGTLGRSPPWLLTSTLVTGLSWFPLSLLTPFSPSPFLGLSWGSTWGW